MKSVNTSWTLMVGLSAAGMIGTVSGALAQTSDAQSNAKQEATLEEIIVTSTRRYTSAQSVPAALTAITGDQLQAQGIDSATQLTQVTPSLYVQSGLYEGSVRFSIRGLSSTDATPTGTSPVALYIDDVYQASQFGTGPQLFDLGRVEILRGPQGTLFGKNTTGGAIQYFSQTPTNEFGGYVRASGEWGDQSAEKIEGAINVPLIDNVLSTRLSILGDRKGNYVTDVGLGRRLGRGSSLAARWQLRWTPSEHNSVNLTLFGVNHHGDPVIYHGQYIDPCNDPFGNPYLCGGGATPVPAPPVNPDTVALSVPSLREDYFNYGATLRIEQELGSNSLTSITAYKRSGDDYRGADSGLPGDLFHAQAPLKLWQVSEELRIATDANKTLSGVAGVYASRDNVDVNMFVGSTDAGPGFDYVGRNFFKVRDDSVAVFGNLTWKFASAWSVIGGARYTAETRHDVGEGQYYNIGNPLGLPDGFFDWTQGNVNDPSVPTARSTDPVDARKTWSKLTWDATLNYQPNDRTLTYFKVAKGFRSGGFVLPLTFTPTVPDPVEPENLLSFEAGIKTDVLDDRMRINASIYHYKFTDQQVFQFNQGNLVPTNAGTSQVDGAEVEVQYRPVKALNLGANVGYNKARFTNYKDAIRDLDFSGKSLQQAPRWTGNVSASYAFNIVDGWTLTPSTDWSYRSKIYFEPDNNDEVGDKARTIGNVRLALGQVDGGWSVAAYVNNLTDQRPVTYAYSYFNERYIENGKVFGIGRATGIEVGYKW